MKRKTRLPWNWKNRLVLVREEIDDHLEYTLCFRKGTTPRGCSRQIGSFIVEDYRIHSEIEEHFQNRGLGLMCYRSILHELGELRTCYHAASPQAQAVWGKLIKHYPHKKEFWTSLLTIKPKGKFSEIAIVEK